MAPKNKPNAFLCFMLEWKEAQIKKGKRFPNGLTDVMKDSECDRAWKALSEQKRGEYKAMAKALKYEVKVEKKTGLGENLKDVEEAEKKKQKFQDDMKMYIQNQMRSAKETKSIQDLKFYVIHVNYFYTRPLDNNEHDYHPAEVAICEFSLVDGISNVYHKLINEPIKLGYSSQAKDRSVATHSIPTNAPFGTDDYKQMFKDIKNILNPQGRFKQNPPLYTMAEAVNPVQSFLQRICRAGGEHDEYFRLYSLEFLFSDMYNNIVEQSGRIHMEDVRAHIELKRDPYAYKPGLECQYHEEIQVGVYFCSQSIVKRWIFVICMVCCDPLDIELLSGCHKPEEPKKTLDHSTRSFSTSLNTSFKGISLNDSVKSLASTVSLNGVSEEHRLKVSERTASDEDRRRQLAKTQKPLEIIDHSKESVKKLPEPQPRPLRTPYTKSSAHFFEELDKDDNIDFSEDSFPSIGRGAILKKKNEKQKKERAVGYAAALKH